jgi:hypothetical protein
LYGSWDVREEYRLRMFVKRVLRLFSLSTLWEQETGSDGRMEKIAL